MTARVEWRGIEAMIARLSVYENRVLWAVRAVAEYFAGVMEEYAKENAPWQDQTGNARQTLNTFVEEIGPEAVELYLSHGVDYGVYLEQRFGGRYAIIWPTIEAHLPAIERMLQEIFR